MCPFNYPMQYVRAVRVIEETHVAAPSHACIIRTHYPQGIIHLIKKLPEASVGPKLNEISGRSFRNVDNIRGEECMSG